MENLFTVHINGIKTMTKSTQKAFGNSRTQSKTPFTVNDTPASLGLTGISYIGGCKGVVKAGDSPVYVGGFPYSTQSNGDSAPVIIPAHKSAIVSIDSKGSPASMSEMSVTML